MKTKLFFWSLILCFAFSFSQTTAIPDTNFEQSLVNQGIDTNGMNGNILNADAAVPTFLIVSSAGISNLSGIEAFTSLTFLDCSFNSLTSLDLTVNTALSTVNCSNNLLASIDVSTIAPLFSLDCRINQLASLDVTNNSNLGLLNAGFNPFSSLDVSQNLNLTNLVIDANINMSSIDVTQNTALQFLNTGFVPLGTVDLTQNTALEQLICQSSSLTSLDVSQNAALWNLDARGNQLTTLDLSNNPAMFIMFLNNNMLTSLDVKNGNNGIVPNNNFNTLNNPGLMCVNVDSQAYSDANWFNIDGGTSFSENCTLSINDYNQEQFKMHPNPVVEYLTIDLINDFDYAIYNLMGQLTETGKLKSGNNKLVLDDLSKGVYILNIKNQSSDISKKFIKL